MRILTMRKRVTDALALWFPDREFFMRSQGQIKFVKVSARLQMTVAGAVVAALLLWLVVTLAMLVSQYSISMERMALVQRQAEIVDLRAGAVAGLGAGGCMMFCAVSLARLASRSAT